MNPIRIFASVGLMIGFFWMISTLITSRVVPDEGESLERLEMNRTRPYAPAEAQSMKNLIPVSDKVIEQGQVLYRGKGNCYICHGQEGRGDGEAGVMLSPKPRDLTDETFQRVRTDGEIFWAIKFGVPQTGMFSYVPRMITEEEAWAVVHYIRTLKQTP